MPAGGVLTVNSPEPTEDAWRAASRLESRRLAALERYRILDTGPEAAFDDIVTIAAEVCGVPMAAISLVDSKRQWFKAKVGLGISETARDISFCAHAIQQDEVLLVEDATKDHRFAQNPLVTGDLHLRFYAGTPLQTADGLAIGTLCVLDSEPRTLSERQHRALEALGRQVMNQLKLHQTLMLQRTAGQREAITLRYTDQLRNLQDPLAIDALTAQVLGETLAVATAGYGTLSDDGVTLRIAQVWAAPGAANIVGTHSLLDFGSYAQSLQQGTDLIVEDVETDARTAHRADSYRAFGVRSVVNLPVLENGRLVAVFFALDSKPRVWKDEDLEFFHDVAARARQAIERRRAEVQVRLLAASLHEQVEDRTRERDRLWQLSRDPFLIADTEGLWMRVNPAWTELLGWSDKELLGRTSQWMEHPEDHERTRTEIRNIASGRGTQRFENRFRAKDGRYHWFEWTATPAEGLLYCVARDVSAAKAGALALKEAEDQLRQSHKMEAVGQLTGGLAHDFNNLLTGIKGSLELLQLRITQGRLGEIDRYVNAAQDAAKRAAALTHRLLAFARRQTLDPKPTNVNRLVAEMSELLERTMGPEIALEHVAAAGLWDTLIDPGQLENALLNLCINARDAMPNGGKLKIETMNQRLEQRAAKERDIPPGEYVSIGIRDTGSGMAPEVILRAFDPFYTTKPIGAGTGLGLSMVYGFARQSGGQVRIHSELNHGTLVRLYLPRHRGVGEVAEEPVPESAVVVRTDHAETVLVVDDEPTVRMLVVEVLQEMGCTALDAADGAAGVQLLNTRAQIDLLITDVGLPGGMNGRQLADTARVARPELKVLFITGYAENAILSHDRLNDGMHVLTKPFAVDDLTRKIKELIGSS